MADKSNIDRSDDNSDRILFVRYENLPKMIRAINSPVRRKILNLLYHKEMNINQIAKLLSIPQSTCTVNVQRLEAAGLINTYQRPASKGSQKICTTKYEEAILFLHEEPHKIADNIIETEMPIGLFFDFNVSPSCGLASEKADIGNTDHAESFLNPKRASAQILWFSKGYIEYQLSLDSQLRERVKNLSISLELCSEFPGHRDDWPSDITLWINDIEVGTWTSPGDMGNHRGRLNPAWWSNYRSQYGYLKTWKVTEDFSYIDGIVCSSAKIEDLDLRNKGVVVRIGVKESAENIGGITIYGGGFGDYAQDLLMRIELDKRA